MRENLSEDRYKNFLLLIMLCFCAISLFSFYFASDTIGQFDLKRVFVCSVVIVNCLFLISSSTLRNQLLNRIQNIEKRTAYLLTFFLIFVIISNLFFSLYFIRAQLDFFYLLGLALLTTTLSTNLCCDRLIAYRYFSAISLALFFSVMLGHWIHSAAETVPNEWSNVNFANPRYINQIQVWLIIPTLYITLIRYKQDGLSGSLFLLLLASLHVAIATALDSRGFFLVSCVSVLIWLVIDKINRLPLLKLTGLIILIGIILKYLLLAPFPFYLMNDYLPGSSFDLELRTTSSNRLAVWKELIEMSSFWGYGGDAYVCNSDATTVAGPHNSLLLYLFNWGVLPALLYSLLAISLFVKVITTRSISIRVTGLSVLAGLGHSLLSGTLDLPLSQLMAVISLSLFWHAYGKKTKPAFISQSSTNEKYKTILIATSFIIIVSVSFRVYDRISHDHYRYLIEDNQPLRPQFWMENSCPNTIPYLRKEVSASP